jgi:uncharacterized membrane protein
MKRFLQAIWNQGILATFLSGLFALLPVAITIGIIAWVAGHVRNLLGTQSSAGRALKRLGLQFVNDDRVALAIGAALVLVGIWLLGLLVRYRARHRFDHWFRSLVDRIPVVASIYRTASQVVGMLKKDEQQDLKGMRVVFCAFGRERGGGILALLATPEVYRFDGRDHHIVYVPTSPIPMSGGVLFVPAEAVQPVDMTAEQLMRIYFSLGVLAPQVVPEEHRALSG